jgi:DNA-binding IclR family transcriptional regulator
MGKVLLADLSNEEVLRAIGPLPLERCTARTITDPDQLVSELDRVRSAGYAETINELEDGLVGIAVPVRDPDGALRAIIGVGGPTFRLTANLRAKVLTTTLDGAGTLSEAVGS